MIREIANATYNSTTDWGDEVESITFLKKGHIHLELTNPYIYDESDILAGSTVDIRGVVYTFTTDQTPTGTEVAGLNYIRMDTSTLEYTTVAPEYDAFNHGWYDSTGLKRYILSFYYDAGVYTKKTFITDLSSIDFQVGEKVSVAKKQTWNTAMSFLNKSEVSVQASDKATGDDFGSSVDAYGDYLVVGAPDEATGGTSAGAAYVFHKDEDDNWDEGVKLVASDAAAWDFFGVSVSIDGDYIIVGAEGKGTYTGAAYIFLRTGTNTWDSGTKIVASDAATNDYFGCSVAISGDYVSVGAYAESSSGAAYFFHRTGSNTWDSGTKTVSSDLASNDSFGRSVAIDGDYFMVGASSKTMTYSGEGAAYVFLRTATTTWDSGTQLEAADPEANMSFGTSVSISGTVALVGAMGHSYGSILNAGAVYFFNRTATTTWDTGNMFQGLIPETNDYLGARVKIRGDKATSSPYYRDSGTGFAYYFYLVDDEWKVISVGEATPVAGNLFGARLGITQENLFASAVGYSSNTGIVHAYKLLEKE